MQDVFHAILYGIRGMHGMFKGVVLHRINSDFSHDVSISTIYLGM